jgi:urease accessory protein UreF
MRQSETCAISPPSGDANAPAQLLAEKFAAFLRQIGSPDVFPKTLPFGLPRGGIGGERELCDFLTSYLNEVLAPWEMPAIAQSHRHAERGHIRELIALDRQLNGWPIWPDPASASRRIGREQLERLRPLRDERTVRRYLAAVEAGRASGWHTVVYGLSLAVYSWPLRHGLLTYAQESLTGLACAAARPSGIPAPVCREILRKLFPRLPAAMERTLDSNGLVLDDAIRPHRSGIVPP